MTTSRGRGSTITSVLPTIRELIVSVNTSAFIRTNAPRRQNSPLISASRNDPRVFYHDYHRALRSPRSVHDTFGNDEALPRAESYQPPFEIDQKLTLNNVKKLVVLFVFVPMVFTTKNPQPHD